MSMAIGNSTGINNSYQNNIDKTNISGAGEYKSVFGGSGANSLKFKGKDLEELMQKMFYVFPNQSDFMTAAGFEGL